MSKYSLMVVKTGSVPASRGSLRNKAFRPRGVAVGCSLLVAGTFVAAFSPGSSAVAGLTLRQPPDPVRAGVVPVSDADRDGMFSRELPWPVIAIHSAVMASGDLVTYGTPVGADVQQATVYDNWSPATDTHMQSGPLGVNSFCSVASHAPDGTLFVVGGNTEYASGNYNAATRQFVRQPDLSQPRWYASMVRMPDDRMIIIGGQKPYAGVTPPETDVASTPEIYTAGQGWRTLPGATDVGLYGSAQGRWWYPKTFLAPDGTLFGISREKLWKLNPAGIGAVSQIGTVTTSNVGASGGAVMFAPGRILLVGGGQRTNTDPTVGSAEASVIDINGVAPQVTQTGSMAKGRNWLNATVLPNGEVFVNGGTGSGMATNAVYESEIWNPATGTWRTAASARRIRTYHSSAVLLPNGSVFTAGGGASGPEANFNAEMYYPPYLFTRSNGTVTWADRPEFRSVQGRIAYGAEALFDMKDARSIQSVSLTTLGSSTHSFMADQRRVPLSFSQSGDQLSITFPVSPTLAAPGFYLLHAVDGSGVPTPSQIIELRSDGTAGGITVYGDGLNTPPPTGAGTTTTTTTTTAVPPSSTTSPPGATRDLLAAYEFDESSGPSLIDTSANGNTATLFNGAARSPGRTGSALTLDGTFNQQARAVASPSLDSPVTGFTVSAWVNVNQLQPGWAAITSRQFGTSWDDQWYLAMYNGLIYFGVNTVPGGNLGVGGASLQPQTWTHLAGTYDGSTMRIYVNGTLAGSAPQSGPIRFDNNDLIIGGNQNTSGANQAQDVLNGRIDSLRIYGRALSGAEITSLASPVSSTSTAAPSSTTTTTAAPSTTTTTTAAPSTTTTTTAAPSSTTTTTTTAAPTTTTTTTAAPTTTRPPTTTTTTTTTTIAGSTLRLVTDPAIVASGAPLVITLSGATPNVGRVDFAINGIPMGSRNVDGNGQAQLSSAWWGEGSMTVSAEWVRYVVGVPLSVRLTAPLTVVP